MPVGYHRNVSTASPGDPLGRIGPAGHSASSPSSGATPQLYKIAPEGENRKSNVGSSRLPLALASKHAEPYRLSSPRPPQCGALWATARSPSAAESLRRLLLRGPRVRIRLPPAKSSANFRSLSMTRSSREQQLAPTSGRVDTARGPTGALSTLTRHDAGSRPCRNRRLLLR